MIAFRLPIEDCLDRLRQNLHERDEVILEAPPGAGKTTLVPLSLMQEPWLAGNKILMLEPRRIATKTAAMRMASLIDESPGQTVGYRMRLETKASKHSKIEIITEGILTRMLQNDPSLEGVGLVIFDEFHERNLDSDLALALCLQGRGLFRDETTPLKILVMSATLDSNSIARLLNDAPIISSAGKAYPVEVIHGRARQPKENPVERMVATIKQALIDNPQSSLLAFLPGQGEIRRVGDALASWLLEKKINDIHLHPLFGNLSIEDQQAAIAPLSGSQASDQKVVLATNIAETSLTIEGVDVVVDCGLVREAKFNPATGMTGLHTVKISNASSNQRTGRAGRLGSGKCYRLWSAAQQSQLAAHSPPEILKADLAPLALQLLQWGVGDPAELRWLDPPPRGPWQQAIDLLHSLGAIETKSKSLVLTAHGESMSALPTHPRLAHMLLCGAEIGQGIYATHLASLLSDRDPFAQDNPDINHRLQILDGAIPCPAQNRGWLRRTLDLAQQFEGQLTTHEVTEALTQEQLSGYLLACAYPDRIARRRHSGGYQLANGRSANLTAQHYLANSRWLVVAEINSMDGRTSDMIRTAVALDEKLFCTLLSDAVDDHTIAAWDKRNGRFVAEEQQKIGALILQSNKLDRVPAATKTAALIQHIQQEGLQLLTWTAELKQWCARVSLVREHEGNDWPDVSPQALLETASDWLAPYLNKISLLADFRKLPLKDILGALLDYRQQQRLNQLVPARLVVPSGSAIAIDYSESPPVLAVKLQEMFGCEQTPSVLAGKVPLVVYLLSPAGRPLQITQDLAGFWRTSYHEVKKEMKGRYPKHPWPDDPLVAVPTRRTNHHG
ncbi:MAG: ATP-dependent helicase HrpB [Gammaproteobacteria bacterium]|nr:ATP-dependent helicase HrpB [Gammaproteobacteria bacterium]